MTADAENQHLGNHMQADASVTVKGADTLAAVKGPVGASGPGKVATNSSAAEQQPVAEKQTMAQVDAVMNTADEAADQLMRSSPEPADPDLDLGLGSPKAMDDADFGDGSNAELQLNTDGMASPSLEPTPSGEEQQPDSEPNGVANPAESSDLDLNMHSRQEAMPAELSADAQEKVRLHSVCSRERLKTARRSAQV